MNPGTQLGSYEILSPLGKGGMGEVWRARDSKLGREVAIKTLPEEFAQDEERLARFEREAKLLASLNHPNIAAIYGLEEHNGTRFLVLELVEGDTLAERLKRGDIPVEESLTLALQIAEALEAAHEKGVIHRDLKPANIKVTPDGKIKVLDFGLAKAFAGDGSDVNLSQSPTLSMQATQQGVILGTAAYMSPEQARGVTVDKRADIWAFGCVLYEMLTGRQVFKGELMSDVMASVLARDPDYTALQTNLHPKIKELIRRCLEKDPKQRWHDVGDVRVELSALETVGDEWAQDALEPSSTKTRERLAWGLALVLLVALVIVAVKGRPTPTDLSPVRFAVTAPEGARISNVQFAISPDGTHVAFVVIAPTGRSLWIRSFDSMESRQLIGTEGGFSPFWSPDSRFVGYWADDSLKKIDTLGGPPEPMVSGSQGNGSWNRTGDLLFVQEGIIHLLRAEDGSSTPVTSIDGTQGVGNHREPHFLPDGNHFLYSAEDASGGSIFVGSLDGTVGEHLIDAADSQALYAAGYLVFMRENTLFAQAFDPASRRITGEPFPALSEPVRLRSREGGGFSVSEEGSLLYNPGVLGGEINAYWVDGYERETPLFGPGEYGAAAVSPDGSQVAVTVNDQDGTSSIWLFDSADGTPRALGTDGSSPVWSPDGSRIAFASGNDIYVIPADRSRPPELLWASDYRKVPRSWSSNDELAFEERRARVQSDIWVYKNGDAAPLLETPAHEIMPAFSPDGRSIAYLSDGAVYVQIYPGPAAPLSVGEGEFSRDRLLWASDSRQLFFRTVDDLGIVNLDTGARISVESRGQLFSGTDVVTVSFMGIHPIDDRFLIFRQVNAVESQIYVVLNWFQELKERVPVP